MKLYNYFRSSASFRVRIVLELKGLSYDYVPLHLVRAEHRAAGYADRVGDALVPALEIDDTHLLTQSMAIMEYLDEVHPDPGVMPKDAVGRAHVRALAQMVACEIHPLNNLRVLKYLKQNLMVDESSKDAWYRHWTRTGLEAYERQLALLAKEREAAGLIASRFSWGDVPTMADCCLVPLIFNAQRFHVDLQGLDRTMAAFKACMALPAFQRAQPSACPDNEA
ncbi:maleylacetoacetate isomerase [Diaphorobacter sp. HDW4A]|uniref:maleylacetoacetate isomerase n=1 Tax=Diaphorobacter sp. HDW4A TaxID=2714924 RepID=UPI00140D2C84|nr:maleylacetoacetate isomerase [Diaphorobacter sp. HDW4A]QIL83797.1 maleylacetoacetate isomerase [Diaphorobacter sp. HDW4A]